MSVDEDKPAPAAKSTQGAAPGPGASAFAWAENLIIALALGAMVLLPLTESVLRAAFGVGISGVTSMVQHLTLIVGMLGGALAAREERLLSLATGEYLPAGKLKSAAKGFSHAFGAAVSALLCYASYQFLLTEKEAGSVLAYEIRIWVIQLVLPAGFAIICLRLLWHGSTEWLGRLSVVLATGLIVWLGATPPLPAEQLVAPALALLLAAAAAGAPIFTVLGGAALILFWGDALPIASVPLDHYRLVTNPSLPTIPMFTLAGYFLAEGGASRRLIRVFQALFGSLRGGPAVVTVLVCAFFTSFTGASGVTILALGGLLMPVLVAARYSAKSALGLLTGSGSIGLLFPPCLPLILYAIVAQIRMEEMFLGGLLPGILLVLMTTWWGVRQEPRRAAEEAPRFQPREAWSAVWEAKWEMLLPVVVLGSLFGGFATPVEASAITALYAFVIEAFVYKDLRVTKDAPKVMAECGLLVGGVLLILGVALGFTNYLIDAQIPMHALEWVTSSIESRIVFLLLLNLFLLIVGCLMDIFSAIVVVVPLLVPMGQAFGIAPVHLGIIFLANLELGYLTPPVGMNLFLSSYRFSKPLMEVCRSILPLLVVRLSGVF